MVCSKPERVKVKTTRIKPKRRLKIEMQTKSQESWFVVNRKESKVEKTSHKRKESFLGLAALLTSLLCLSRRWDSSLNRSQEMNSNQEITSIHGVGLTSTLTTESM